MHLFSLPLAEIGLRYSGSNSAVLDVVIIGSLRLRFMFRKLGSGAEGTEEHSEGLK